MYKRKYMLGIVVFYAIFLMAMISAQPPQTIVQSFDNGFKVVENPHEYLTLNQDYQYNFFVYNQSNGILMDNSTINCTFFLANNTGELILLTDAQYLSDGYWKVDILKGNFSEAGGYPYGLSCQDAYGGALSGIFEVTESGVELTEGRSFLIIGLLTLLVFLLFISLYALFNVDQYIGKFALYWTSHVLIIIISFVAWQVGVEGLLGGMALTGVFRIMFWIFTLAVLPMIILSGAWVIYIHTFNEHFEKLIEKGGNTEDAFRMAKRKSGGWFNGK